MAPQLRGEQAEKLKGTAFESGVLKEHRSERAVFEPDKLAAGSLERLPGKDGAGQHPLPGSAPNQDVPYPDVVAEGQVQSVSLDGTGHPPCFFKHLDGGLVHALFPAALHEGAGVGKPCRQGGRRGVG